MQRGLIVTILEPRNSRAEQYWDPTPEPDRRALIRPSDQITLSAVLLAALLSVGVYWLWPTGRTQRLVEVEHASPQQIHFRVDINRADWPELVQLPGIGQTLARRIVESRYEDGPCLSLNDLNRVEGIGPRTMDAMRPFLLPMPATEMVADP